MGEKTVLITGATDGIGKQTALELARKNFRVLLHGRDADKGRQVLQSIREETGNAHLNLLTADFTSLKQVRRLAAEVKEKFARLDVLLNNAGVFRNKRALTEDGFEVTFAVNHLAPFLLTNLLLDHLKTSAPARIVTVSSMTHRQAEVDFGNLQGEKHFSGHSAYALSKFGNVVFTYELAERLEGSGVTANCLHPGVIGTKLLRQAFGGGGSDVEQGARTSVYLASAPEVENVNGKYFTDCEISRSGSKTHDRGIRKKFWEVSAELTGLK